MQRCRAMRDHDISQRRACRLVGVDPKTVRRERPPDNPEDSQGDEGDCQQAPPVWLSADRRDAGAQRNDHEPQEAVSALHRGKAGRQATTGPQTGAWIADTDASGSDGRASAGLWTSCPTRSVPRASSASWR